MSGSAPVDRTERLLNLVLCLLGARSPVARSAIRSIVPGYDSAASDSAFERMFERDKEELRGMGIPVETVTNPRGEVEGYRIDPGDYGLTRFDLTAAQRSILGVAARAFSQASLGARATTALRKIEAAAGEPLGDVPLRLDLTAAPSPADTHLPTLWAAVRTRSRVTFDYRRPEQTEAATRIVEPWGVVSHDGGWYLVGRDTERDAPRTFRTTRIVGAVRTDPERGTFAIPDVDVRGLVATSPSDGESAVADVRVRVAAGSGARLRLRAGDRAGSAEEAVLTVPAEDPGGIVGDVLATGGDAEVLAPPSLRAHIRSTFDRIAAAHADDRAGG